MSGFGVDTALVAQGATKVHAAAETIRSMNRMPALLSGLSGSMQGSSFAETLGGSSNAARSQLQATLAIADGLASSLTAAATKYDHSDDVATSSLMLRVK